MENYYEQAKIEANTYFAAEGSGMELYGQGSNVALGEQIYAGGERASVSQPLIIIAENTGTATDTNIELFDAQSKAYSTTPEITGASSLVVLTSGIPGVTFSQIMRAVANGETYRFTHLRIQVLDASTESLKDSAADSSIQYSARTTLGETYSAPIYPMLSSIQQVKYIRDIQQTIIVNANAKFTVQDLTAGTKVRYMFYAQQIGSPTAGLMGESGKSLDVKNPNAITW